MPVFEITGTDFCNDSESQDRLQHTKIWKKPHIPEISSHMNGTCKEAGIE